MQRSNMMARGGRFNNQPPSLMGNPPDYGRNRHMGNDQRIVLMSNQMNRPNLDMGMLGRTRPNLQGSGGVLSNPSMGYGDLRQQLNMGMNRRNVSSSNRMPNNRNNVPSSGVQRISTKSSGRSSSPPVKRSRPTTNTTTTGDGSKGKFKCQVCRLQFLSIDDFDSHMGSAGHAANMQAVSAVYNDKNLQLKTSSSVGSRQEKSTASHDGISTTAPSSTTTSTASRPGVCDVCDRSYHPKSRYSHMQSREHQNKQHLVSKGCVLCRIDGFTNYTAYVHHIDGVEHKQKKKDLQMSKSSNTTTSSVQDKNSGTSAHVQSSKSEESDMSGADRTVSNITNETALDSASVSSDIMLTGLDSDDMLDDIVYNSDTAIGVEEVISVTGYFCKLCHKFYNNETMARITHCKTQAHFDRYIESIRKKRQKSAQFVIVDEVTTTQQDTGSTST